MGLDVFVANITSPGTPELYDSEADYQEALNEHLKCDGFVRRVVECLAPAQAQWLNGSEDDDLADRMGQYPLLHYLRRYACHVSLHDRAPDPVTDGNTDDAAVDEIVERMNAFYDGWDPLTAPAPSGPPPCRFSHLVWHSDCDGVYVPTFFKDPVFIEFEGNSWSIGSSVALLAELDALKPYLGMQRDHGELSSAELQSLRDDYRGPGPFPGDPFAYEKWAWSLLHWLARESVARRQPIIYA